MTMHYFLFPTPFVICVLGIFELFEYAFIDTVRKLARIRIVEKCIVLIQNNSFMSPGLHFVSQFASNLWTNQISIVLHK